MDTFDEYIFVVRTRIGKYEGSYWIYVTDGETIDKKTERTTHFIDVKSEGLRDILRSVLQGVDGTFLKEDKPTVWNPIHWTPY